MNLLNKKKLLGLLREYAVEKCTEHHGDGHKCPFNEGADEGMHWCGFRTIASELGKETGQGDSVYNELWELQDKLMLERFSADEEDED
jgi:hypothetical protein